MNDVIKPAAGAEISASNNTSSSSGQNKRSKPAANANKKHKKAKKGNTSPGAAHTAPETSLFYGTEANEPAAGAAAAASGSAAGASNGGPSMAAAIVVAATITALAITTAVAQVRSGKAPPKRTLGHEFTLYSDVDDLKSGTIKKIPESRMKRAMRLGLKIGGGNAILQAEIESNFLMSQFKELDNLDVVSGGRGHDTTDAHLRKV